MPEARRSAGKPPATRRKRARRQAPPEPRRVRPPARAAPRHADPPHVRTAWRRASHPPPSERSRHQPAPPGQRARPPGRAGKPRFMPILIRARCRAICFGAEETKRRPWGWSALRRVWASALFLTLPPSFRQPCSGNQCPIQAPFLIRRHRCGPSPIAQTRNPRQCAVRNGRSIAQTKPMRNAPTNVPRDTIADPRRFGSPRRTATPLRIGQSRRVPMTLGRA